MLVVYTHWLSLDYFHRQNSGFGDNYGDKISALGCFSYMLDFVRLKEGWLFHSKSNVF